MKIVTCIEDIAAAIQKPFWFQLYVMPDRGFVRSPMAQTGTTAGSAATSWRKTALPEASAFSPAEPHSIPRDEWPDMRDAFGP